MANRSPQGDTDQYPSMPAWRPPQPGSYAPPDQRGHHAHDGERELHAQGNLPHYHDPDSGILVFFDPAASAPNGAASEVGPIPATSSPSEAATPDGGVAASEPALTGGSGGAAGSGRPTSLEELPVTVVHVPFDPTGQHEAAGKRSHDDPGPAPERPGNDHVHLTQFEALRVTTALSEVALRLGQPVLHAADKQEMAMAVLLIRDQLVARADQAHQAAWGIGEVTEP